MTGLTLPDFDLLVSLGVFNRELMNDAVYKFKRYEDSSLSYTGINTHEGENVGGFDTVITESTFRNMIPMVDLSSTPTLSVVGQEKEDEKDEVKEERNNDVSDEVNEEVNDEESAPWLSYKVGDTVMHKSFGSGIITSLDNKYIWIKFATNEKKFFFPQCFEKGFVS